MKNFGGSLKNLTFLEGGGFSDLFFMVLLDNHNQGQILVDGIWCYCACYWTIEADARSSSRRYTQSRIQGLVWAHLCYGNAGFIDTNDKLWYIYTNLSCRPRHAQGQIHHFLVFYLNVWERVDALALKIWLNSFCFALVPLSFGHLVWTPKPAYQRLKAPGYAIDTAYGENQNYSDCNGTRTYNHLVRKRTLNHLAKLT